MRYETHPVDDDGWTGWIQPVEKEYRMSCCDCGLVHKMDFRVEDGRVQFRGARHPRATAAKRTWRKRQQGNNEQRDLIK